MGRADRSRIPFEPKIRSNGLVSVPIVMQTAGLLLDDPEHAFTKGTHKLLRLDRPDAAGHAGARYLGHEQSARTTRFHVHGFAHKAANWRTPRILLTGPAIRLFPIRLRLL
jgi:hypothetical protein